MEIAKFSEINTCARKLATNLRVAKYAFHVNPFSPPYVIYFRVQLISKNTSDISTYSRGVEVIL